ncbi:hypothetical protein [Sphingobacterium griseoflavum]|uniref:DUF1735 domain-containing protein n=1 Tax=Sphingobacterium griseoflavum TaxID=1474952 RepID=A0ABQ3I2N7_9SPHI|nr:hypothetical protein [Sphingobacterium griseoflavum]GHE48940.1 hypothetical protein GCM10017764_35020 [Sphingobacterium griseoflavum]
MKKILLAFLLGTATLAVGTSCTKEYYDTVVPSITMVYSRDANQWQNVQNTTTSKFVNLSVPELTDYYVKQGIVNVAISFDNESNYNTLPATIDGVSYNYEYTAGSLTVFAQDPLLEDGINVPVPQRAFFKISLTEADFVE